MKASVFVFWMGLILIAIALSSCSQIKPQVDDDFLKPEEITKQFIEMQNSKSQAEELAAPVDISRTLVPNDEFLGSQKGTIEKTRLVIQPQMSGKEAVKGSVDLRSKDAPIVSQWDGTCTAHGLAGVVENLAGVDLSERHIWSKYQRYSCESAINAWSKYAACITTEKGWSHGNTKPYKDYKGAEKCFTFIDKTTYIGSDLNKMIASLDAGRPVYIGMQVTKSMANCTTVLNPLSKGTSGGHALSIVGYKLDPQVSGGGYFTIRNSWGSGCGDKGYQYVPFNHCTRDDLYCIMWTIDSIETHGLRK